MATTKKPKAKALTTEQKLKKLQAENRKLVSENKELKQATKESKKDFLMARKSTFQLYVENTYKDVFAFYIQTKNSDGSRFIHRFVKEPTKSQITGNVYYKGYMELISAKEIARLSAELKATQSDKGKETVSKTESTPC